MDKISYALGISLGENLLANGLKNLNYSDLARALEDVLERRPLEIDVREAQQILNKYLVELQQRAAEEAKTEGRAFLAENAKRAEVKTLPSGLQYEIIREGSGKKPKASDRVQVHYHGTLIDGTVFDSSVQRGELATFGVTQVISGWVEALQLMTEGAKWKLFIPSDLAYGSQGAGAHIKPHSTLIFEVELLKIV
ncbi:MAG: FKBP-type peptidyl-prolyl cis-trans isomerase [Paludibacter sp.]|jgi:FKBP-type peptidyl-prolyl cis-trans isomerase FklB|nr:FKBP-type peptidyl-prolyl cis-trans isomerase [Paludibacter sp.]